MVTIVFGVTGALGWVGAAVGDALRAAAAAGLPGVNLPFSRRTLATLCI
jgi:hypothetical protein